MARTISMKTLKASRDKPNGKPLTWDKSLGVEPAVYLYEIEYGDKTEGVKEAEILIVHDSSLVTFNQNIIKRKFPYINMFYHKVPTIIHVMRNLTVRLFGKI